MTAVLLGTCRCGCGRDTPLASKTSTSRGWVKGQPLAYLHGHSGGAARVDPVARFWSFVDVAGPDECWPWTGGLNNGGYGKFWVDGQTVGAHRYSLILATGPLDDGLVARHKCDNPPCVNPAHLEPGTPLDNAADAVERDRHGAGERNGRALLTAEQVRTIRSKYAGGAVTQQQLADEFGVARSTIHTVTSGQAWATA